LIVEIDSATAVDLDGKVKFPSGVVVFAGDRNSAPKWLSEHGGAGRAIVGSKNTGGYGSTNTGGYGSTNTGGDHSTNTGGDHSKNTGGDHSKNTGGVGSTAKSGDLGVIAVDWWDGKRRRIAVGYVGEDGIKPNTFYRCDESGKLVEVTP
jgi:hypothetical protein